MPDSFLMNVSVWVETCASAGALRVCTLEACLFLNALINIVLARLHLNVWTRTLVSPGAEC